MLFPHLVFARPIIEKIESLSNELGLLRQEMAIGYIKSEMPNAYVIFGAETPTQVRENMTAWQKETPKSLCNRVKTLFTES